MHLLARAPHRWLLLAGALILSLAKLCADQSEPAWLVRVWKMGSDLAGNNVAGVVESSDGFIWAVAGGELVRFDGVNFKHFSDEEIGGSAGRRIREFTPLREGGVAYALMNGTIVRTDRTKAEILSRELVESKSRIESLYEDTDGSFLIASYEDSVARLRAEHVRRFTANDGLPPGLNCRFSTDSTGHLWFVKGNCVGMLREDRFEVLRRFDGEDMRLAIAPARKGGVWIGAGNWLLHGVAGGPFQEICQLPKDLPSRPTVLYEDRSGAVWFGTALSGLFRYNGEKIESIPISHRYVSSLVEDREGSLWVGTTGGGLNQIQPRAMTIEGNETGLPSETVQAICEDTKGTLWAITQNRLVVTRRPGGWKTPADFKLGDASCIAADTTGGIWIGTRNGQLHEWRDGRLTSRGTADGLTGAPLHNLVTTRSGDIWLGTERPAAVQRLRAGQLKTFPFFPQDPMDIRAMTEDAAGNLWVAGSARALVCITKDDLVLDESRFTPSPPQQVRVLKATADGSVWVGYGHAGIGRINGEHFGQIRQVNGLWNDNIEMMIPDGRGWLWLAADQTIFKVSQNELTAVAEGRAQQVKSIRYGQDQGVRAGFGESAGALVRSDGQVLIPMATSLAMIDPMLSREDSAPPPVVVTEVRINEKPVAVHAGLFPLPRGVVTEDTVVQLPPNHQRLDVDFSALSYRTPADIRFRYRLDGFDHGWIEGGSRRSVSYSRLPKGEYHFQVKAGNSEGVWNETGASIAFIVSPFFWETWWFRTIAFIGFTSSVFVGARYLATRRLQLRLRALEQETALERERARIARDIHDDLGSRLTKIVLLTGLVARDRAAPEKANERVWEISETARQLIKSLDETVWAVNPRNDTLPHLIDYLGQFAVSFLRTAEVLCHVDLPPDPPERRVSSDVRHHLFLTVKEALNNVVRHVHANAAWLRVEVTNTALTIGIEDDGCGFAQTPDAPGADGLHNMRQRMTQIGGEFTVESRPGAGTRITLTVPLTKGTRPNIR